MEMSGYDQIFFHPNMFQMRAQNFILNEEAFHMKVNSLMRIVGEVQEGKPIYFFEGMVTQPLPRETFLALRKLMAEEQLEPVIKKL